MSVLPDTWIRKMALEHGMITPFTETLKREGVISYGVSSYGYDARVSDEFKIFTNVDSAIVDFFAGGRLDGLVAPHKPRLA